MIEHELVHELRANGSRPVLTHITFPLFSMRKKTTFLKSCYNIQNLSNDIFLIINTLKGQPYTQKINKMPQLPDESSDRLEKHVLV